MNIKKINRLLEEFDFSFFAQKEESLKDSPAYPLARSVGMPEDWGYPTASLAFRFFDMRLGGFENVKVDGSSSHFSKNRIKFDLLLEKFYLKGHYAVEAKPDPIPVIDTAGNMSDIPANSLRPRAGGNDSLPDGIDPQKEQWLDQAREQRDRLSSTENGQKLMGLYNEHNETYDEVFKTYPALASAWQAQGATKEMAADTSDAVQKDSVLNQTARTYSGGVTYNGNAFAQQLNVAVACLFADPDFDPRTGPPTDSKYVQASKAALSFGKGVGTATNNTKDKTKEIKPSEVHSVVDTHKAELPAVSNTEIAKIIGSSDLSPGGKTEGSESDWFALDEEDRTRIRKLKNAILKQKAETSDLKGLALFVGEFESWIRGASVQIEIEYGDDSKEWRKKSVRLSVPAFQFEIDDSSWTGEAGNIARERLENMYFIRSLLYDSLFGRLESIFLASTYDVCYHLNKIDSA